MKSSLQSILANKLNTIRLKNPTYSLRAFARKLKISPSSLSEIISGKRRISEKVLGRICTTLELTPHETQQLEYEIKTRKWVVSSKSTFESPERRILDLSSTEEHTVVSDWIHYSITCLLETMGTPRDPAGIAKRLRVSKARVQASLERLHAKGLIRINKDGEYECIDQVITTPDLLNSSSLLARHRSNLKAAKHALDRAPPEFCDFAFGTMAFDPEQIPVVRKMVRQFLNQLIEFSDSHPKREVFEVSIQLFPRTHFLK